MNFNNIRNFISYLAPSASPSSSPFPGEEEKVLLSKEAVLEESKECHFPISPIQFVHRVLPAYIKNTSMDSKDVESSLDHWIRLLSLWIENKAMFLPLNIAIQDLKYLRSVLEDYKATKNRYVKLYQQEKISDEEFFKAAATTLEQIRHGLSQQKNGIYTASGYLGGINGGGHELPIKFIDRGKKVECLILTLGEGVQFHPQVGWKSTSALYHFQSFPIMIDKTALFSEAGEEVFARLIRLQVSSYPAEVRGYSAEDVFFALASLGQIRASYDTPVADRERKEQRDNICADLAVVLMIHDVLIDLGNDKEKIRRLFCLEKLCNLLFYKHSLEKGINLLVNSVTDSSDPWIVLKNGVKEFSVRSLKVSKSVLSDGELALCYSIVRHLLDYAKAKIKESEKTTISLNVESKTFEESAFLFGIKDIICDKQSTDVPLPRASSEEFSKPSKITTITSPKEVSHALKTWLEEAEKLKENNPKELSAFVYRSLLSLAIPENAEKGFWDYVPASEISEILESFVKLAILGVNATDQNDLVYRNVLILSSSYAIVDCLVRRKWNRYLENFASPFTALQEKVTTYSFFTIYDFASKEKSSTQFNFKIIHLKRANEHWKKIRNYFESSMESKTYTLFAPYKEYFSVSVEASKTNLLDPLSEWDSVTQHLKFLEQFFNPAFQENVNNATRLDAQFSELLLNENDQFIPSDIEVLYFFAHYTSHAFVSHLHYIQKTRVERQRIVEGTEETILIPMSHSKIDTVYQTEMGCKGLFLNHGNIRENFSENDVFCKPQGFFPSDFQESELKIPKQWWRLFLHPSLQITSAIQWMRNNIARLHRKEFQFNLELALFEPGLLVEKVKSQPSILEDLRKVIKEAIVHYSSHTIHFKTVLFLVRIGVCIESYDHAPSLETLTFYEKHLLEHVQKFPDFQTFSHLLFLYQLGIPNRQSLAELISAQFWVLHHDLDPDSVPPWLLIEASGPLQSYCSQIAECLEDIKWSERLFNKIFTSLFPTMPLPEGEYTSSYPFISKGEYRLDIRYGRVFCATSQLTLVPGYGLMWLENGIFSSLDRTLQITPTEQGALLSRRLSLIESLGLKGMFYQLQMPSQMLDGCILENSALFNHWMLETGEAILIETKKTLKSYLALKKEKGFCIYKLHPNGTLGPILMNIYAKQNGMKQWFERLGAFQDVCIWYNEKTGQIEEIDSFSLNLSFKGEMVGERWRLRSVNFPEFFLADEQSLPELDYFSGAIVLENESSTAVLIPFRRIDQNEADFSTDVTLKKEFITGKVKFFFYHFDEIANVFIHPSPEANFFLSLLFAKKRDYQKALLYLNRAKNFGYVFKVYREVIETFYESVDNSPEALAFYMRLSLHLIENATQPILEGYGTKKADKGNLDPDFFIWVGKKLNQYMRVCSTKEVSRIPAYIKLSLKEEAFLLQFLKRILIKNDQDSLDNAVKKYTLFDNSLVKKILDSATDKSWSTTLDLRSQLIAQGEWSSVIFPSLYYLHPMIVPFVSISKKRFLKDPLVFSRTPPQKGFVRLTREQMRAQFIYLYERAQKGKASLDIFFLHRSGEIGTFTSTFLGEYATLLQIVQKQPYQFAGCNFGDDPTANKEVFKNIVDIAMDLYSPFVETTLAVKAFAYDQSHFFAYQRHCSLKLPSLPKVEPIAWQFDQIDGQIFQSKRKEVFVHFTHSFIESEEVAILEPATPFAFPLPLSDKLSPIEKRLMTSLYKGYQRLLDPKHGKSVYRLKAGKTIEDVINEAEPLLKKIRENIKQVKALAEKTANSFPENAFHIGLRKVGENLTEITIEKILTEAYQNKDLTIIKRANPTLSPKEIYELVRCTVQYHLYRIQIFQLEKGLKALKEGNLQSFGDSISCPGEFNPFEEPEIYLYQSRTGKSLWKSQAEVLAWEVETSKQGAPLRLFSATAGEGKTTLYLPIAMKRLHRMNLIPFSVSPRALYPVDREGLAHTSQHVFSFDVGVFEVALSTKANGADFKWLYEQLISNPNQGFKITPETYYALNLKYQLSLETENEKAVKWISKILSFFAHKGAVLIDECRVNCSPFTQAKIGIGKQNPLPESDIRVAIEIYRALVSSKIFLKDGRSVREVARLAENLQATMTDQERLEVKEAVLSFLAKSSFFKISPKEREEICDYWRGKIEEPLWHRKQPIREIDLVKIFFDEFFDVVTQLVWRMKHVRSIKHGEEIHVPARNKQATLAYFEEVYLTLFATIQGVLQEGLTLAQAETLFIQLSAKAAGEVGGSNRVSEIEASFREWTKLETVRFSNFSVTHANSMKEFHQLVKKNTEAIFWYLEQSVLEQIQYSAESLTVTPIHFLHAFKNVTLFSADPGSTEIYGIYDKGPHVKVESAFVAHAIHRFGSPENRKFLTFPPFGCALDFFNTLFNKDPTLFSHIRMICDAGGLLRDFTAEEIVEAFFQFIDSGKTDLDGIIIFEESSRKEMETNLMLYLKGGCFWELKGHDIPKALKSIGLNWEKLKLLTFIDPSHREGANIEQPKNSSVLVLLGEDLTTSNAAQGVSRGRGVLKKEQKVIWGAAEKLMKTISPKEDEPLQSTINWEVKNEERITEKEWLLTGCHQISYIISKPVWEQLERELDSPEKQIKTWKKYRKGLVKKAEIDPVIRFKGKRAPKDVGIVLWEYARECYDAFGYVISWDKAIDVHSQIAPIIAWIKKEIGQISTLQSFDARKHTYIHTFQRQHVKKEQTITGYNDLQPEEAKPLPRWLKVNNEDFVSAFASICVSARTLFGSSYLTENLYFSYGAIHTAKSAGKSLKENYRKPVQYILLMKEKEKFYAFALADMEAAEIQSQLLSLGGQNPCALLGWNGLLAQNGHVPLTDTDLNSAFVQDVLVDVSLSRWEVLNPLRLCSRLEKWSDFWPMWQKIKQGLPQFYDEANVQAIEKLVPAHLKKNIEKKSNNNNDPSIFRFF